MVPGNPVKPGDPDLYSTEFPNTLRAFTKDGRQLWAVSPGAAPGAAGTAASAITTARSAITVPVLPLASIPPQTAELLSRHGAFDTSAILRQQDLIARQLQDSAQSPLELDAVHVAPAQVVNTPLNVFLSRLSAETNIGFCAESREVNGNSTLGNFNINLPLYADDTLKTVLDRLHRSYPAVAWSIQSGAVIISSKDIKDNPLDLPLKPFSFKGTLHEFVLYLDSMVPGLMMDSVEMSGMYDRSAVYKLQTSSKMRVKEALGLITSTYGVRWNAVIRDEGILLEIPGGPDGKNTRASAGRVTVVFARGPIPQKVQ